MGTRVTGAGTKGWRRLLPAWNSFLGQIWEGTGRAGRDVTTGEQDTGTDVLRSQAVPKEPRDLGFM